MASHPLLTMLVAVLLAPFIGIQTVALQFDPNSISLETRHEWCVSQVSVCATLCKLGFNHNDCVAETLKFNCECKNFPTPNLLNYNNTIPSLACYKLFLVCDGTPVPDERKASNCWADIGSKCGVLDPEKFDPAATSTTGSKSSFVTSPSADDASSTSSTGSDETATSDTHRTSSTAPSSSDPTTDTRTTSTPPNPTTTDAWPGAQNTTAPLPKNTTQVSNSEVQLIGMALGITGGVCVFVIAFLWWVVRWRQRRDKEKAEESETDRRSIRSNRGSVLVMREMSTDAIRNHLANIETKDESTETMLPRGESGSRIGPAELPGHFPRSHSRIFEVA